MQSVEVRIKIKCQYFEKFWVQTQDTLSLHVSFFSVYTSIYDSPFVLYIWSSGGKRWRKFDLEEFDGEDLFKK